MKIIKKYYFLFAILFIEIACNSKPIDYRDSSFTIDERVAALISEMTIEEKIAQLITFTAIHQIIDDEDRLIKSKTKQLFKDGIGAVSVVSAGRGRQYALGIEKNVEINNAIQKQLVEETRLGIPAFVFEEGLHGYMAREATSFPQSIALASTWNTELIKEMASATALEMRSRGATQALSPVLGLARDPRWGRTEETYGEDPFLVSEMACAFVEGMQGTGNDFLNQDHVLATLKHFAVYSQPESGQNCAPGNFSKREILENFLYPFENGIKNAGAMSVMASYNEIDGVPSHANHNLLTSILKEEWGFSGYTVGDLTGVERLFTIHKVAKDTAEAAKIAIDAGVDIELPKKNCYHTLVEQIKNGDIKEKLIDESLRRILRLKFQLGLFENPYVDINRAKKVNECAEHKSLARKTAEEAMVLLKNENNLLPINIDKIKNLAVIGPNAADIHLGGYSDEPRQGVSVLEGFKTKGEGKFNVHYAKGCKIVKGVASFWTEEIAEGSDEALDRKLIAEAVEVAKKCDAVMLVLGGNETSCRESWGSDHTGDRDDLDLPGLQDELAKAIKATGKPIVVLLINGRPLTINYINNNLPAIIECWYLGEEGGHAVADVVFGKVNPSGKLPITFPVTVGQIPSYYYKKPSRRRKYLFAQNQDPLFPFGFGLSYTSFDYKNLKVSPSRIKKDGKAKVSVDITNTGPVTGQEIVQLYIRDKVSSVTRPVKQLKGFEKIELRPGETQTVKLTITPDKLQFYDKRMNRVVEPGEFLIMVGPNSIECDTIKLTVND